LEDAGEDLFLEDAGEDLFLEDAGEDLFFAGEDLFLEDAGPALLMEDLFLLESKDCVLEDAREDFFLGALSLLESFEWLRFFDLTFFDFSGVTTACSTLTPPILELVLD
jgi:hypothetical protein